MSQGGYLSLRAAVTAPERVRALVLIDTQSGVEDPANLAAYDQLIDTWAGAEEAPQEILDIVAAIILGDGWAGTPAWQDKWRNVTPDQLRQAYKTLVTREDDVVRPAVRALDPDGRRARRAGCGHRRPESPSPR